MRRIKREDEKGAMGVGTLIVFIAMVLVAAVAASVLIDTANKLQQQAEQTGDQAIREVSTAFTVKDVYGVDGGTYGDENGKIDTLYMKIGLAAGAPAQDMDQTIIQLKNDTAEANLQNGSSAGSSDYTIDQVIEQSDPEDGYLEQGDILEIEIDVTSALDDGSATVGLGPQEDVSIQIIPKHGTPTYEQITTPPTIINTHVDLG